MNTMTVTTLDNERLRQMIDRTVVAGPGQITPALLRLAKSLATARIVAPTEISRKIATINSHVTYQVRGPDSDAVVVTVTLVPPAKADLQLGRVSVLSAAGGALLGLAEGDRIDWPDEAGQMARYTLLKVIFQPEAVGRFDL